MTEYIPQDNNIIEGYIKGIISKSNLIINNFSEARLEVLINSLTLPVKLFEYEPIEKSIRREGGY